jgi:hypothetical protein
MNLQEIIKELECQPADIANNENFVTAINNLRKIVYRNRDIENLSVPLENYTIDEKVKFFDECYKMAKEDLHVSLNDGYVDEHYHSVQLMSCLNLRDPNFWDKYEELMF